MPAEGKVLGLPSLKRRFHRPHAALLRMVLNKLFAMKTIDRVELDHWADESRPFALLNVLPDRAQHQAMMPPASMDEARHEFVAQLGTDKEQAVVLYESTTATVSPPRPAHLLHEAGFQNVYHFAGPHAAPCMNQGMESEDKRAAANQASKP